VLLFSDNGEGLYLVVAAMVGYNSTISCILLVLYYLYVYQLCIVMFINISNVWVYLVTKSTVSFPMLS
jgi:hypothetical protein